MKLEYSNAANSPSYMIMGMTLGIDCLNLEKVLNEILIIMSWII